eukprot:665718-Amphidinium_carterae.1
MTVARARTQVSPTAAHRELPPLHTVPHQKQSPSKTCHVTKVVKKTSKYGYGFYRSVKGGHMRWVGTPLQPARWWAARITNACKQPRVPGMPTTSKAQHRIATLLAPEDSVRNLSNERHENRLYNDTGVLVKADTNHKRMINASSNGNVNDSSETLLGRLEMLCLTGLCEWNKTSGARGRPLLRLSLTF